MTNLISIPMPKPTPNAYLAAGGPCLSRCGRWRLVASCVLLVSLAVGWVLLGTSAARACSTPVYRYAMYNWPPAPYFVFYLHSADPAKEDQEVNRLVEKLAESPPALANVIFEPVDLSKGELDRLPQPVKEAWEKYAEAEGKQPEAAHLVFTSWGIELFSGRLDATTLQAMVESPVRKKICQLLKGGCGMVAVLLPGSEGAGRQRRLSAWWPAWTRELLVKSQTAENARAERVLKKVIEDVASGEIYIESALAPYDAYGMPPDAEDTAQAAEGDEAPGQPDRLRIGLVKVSRSDKAEKWLVDSLMRMEADLPELADQPMIFFFYGRGRAMWPYVGKGITVYNLAGEAQFLGGPCSCMVKDGNPGVDLLMRWDWDATAEAMASKDPAFYGGPFGYQEFSVGAGAEESSAAGEGGVEVASVTSTSLPADEESESTEPGASQPPETTERPVALPTDEDLATRREIARERPEALAVARHPQPLGADLADPAEGPEPQEAGSFARRQMWTLGLVFAAAAVLVLGAGWMLARKRGAPTERP
jgi:hypothetical protein